jgi:hypothetical protein
MERLNDQSGLELLRQANENFGRFFARSSGTAVLGGDEEVAAMLQVESTLKSVGAFLDGRLQGSEDSRLRNELSRYRANLVRLRHQLAAMQNAAAACQRQLLDRQRHLDGIKSWCVASRSTT